MKLNRKIVLNKHYFEGSDLISKFTKAYLSLQKLTVFPKNVSAGEMQVAETVTQHIGMPIITEENSDEEGTMIEILTNWWLFFKSSRLCCIFLKLKLMFWTMCCCLAIARLVFSVKIVAWKLKLCSETLLRAHTWWQILRVMFFLHGFHYSVFGVKISSVKRRLTLL